MWTTEPPTLEQWQSGHSYWWWRRDSASRPKVVEVFYHGVHKSVSAVHPYDPPVHGTSHVRSKPVTEFDGEWCGPIPLPE